MARYREMLDKAIKDSGKTLREIRSECENRGLKIDITSISKWRKGEQNPPSEPGPKEIALSKNRVLAEILSLDEDEFVLAGALEHTPPEVLKYVSVEQMTILKHQEVIGASAVHKALKVISALSAIIPKETKEAHFEALAPDQEEFLTLVDAYYKKSETAWRFPRKVYDIYQEKTGNDPFTALLKDFANNYEGDSQQDNVVDILTEGLAREAGIDPVILKGIVAGLRTKKDK